VFFDDRVTERHLGMDPVQVAPSLASPLDVAGVLQITKDSVRVALCDICRRSDLPHPHIWRLGDGEQDLGVIRDERPPAGRHPAEPTPRRSCSGHSTYHAADGLPLAQPAMRPTSR
jgi:hypothetical protein